ncbi:MAG: hypothetical protein H6621_12600 [Halobacteriovoraceae bacterium]|nr:hypothetical protein [Halobacteriovoraceae bacterium]
MKIAIIGTSLEALECAATFAELGAQSILWGEKNPAEVLQFYQKNFSQSVSQAYLDDLLNRLKGRIFYKSEEIIRIQKSHLDRNETPSGRSRMADSFRVVYKGDFSDHQIPESLAEQMKNSLSDPLEYYEEVDFVVYAPNVFESSKFIGGDAPCLQESKWREHEAIHYGLEALKIIPKKESANICLVGDDQLVLSKLMELEGWLDTSLNHKLFIISKKSNPFASSEEFNALYARAMKTLEKRIQDFEEQKAEEPIPQLNIFAGHSVLSIDRLVDRNQFYMTCEIPNFRDCEIQKDNARKPLKTLEVDEVFVLSGFHESPSPEFAVYFDKNEPGYYHLRSHFDENRNFDYNLINESVQKIKDDTQKYFTRQ